MIYGYAAINEQTFKLIPLNEQFDVIQDNYRKVTDLKKRHPRVKFLLSVGGNADISGEEGAERNLKYRTLVNRNQPSFFQHNTAFRDSQCACAVFLS